MKIKHIFEPSDFENGGQCIIRNSFNAENKNYNGAETLSYKIGYLASCSKTALMISLADGMAIEFGSLEALCDHLNSDKFGFRPITLEEMNGINEAQGNRFVP